MDSALGWLGLLILLLGGGGAAPSRARGGGGSRPAPSQLPQGQNTSNTAPPPLPWPQVTPVGLPSFPGSAWEYDEPPPPVVQQRAGQLVAELWKQGSGSYRIEQTAGRWIAFRAEKVKSGKQGVVAYRIKAKALPAPSSQPRTAAKPPPAAAPAVRTAPAPRVVTSPGIPQPARPPAATPASSSVPLPSQLALPTLRRGAGIKPKAPDANVRILQQKLGIKPDGQFGAGTETAVKEFQRRAGLKVDGIVGAATWTALFAVRA